MLLIYLFVRLYLFVYLNIYLRGASFGTKIYGAEENIIYTIEFISI